MQIWLLFVENAFQNQNQIAHEIGAQEIIRIFFAKCVVDTN